MRFTLDLKFRQVAEDQTLLKVILHC